MAFNLELSPKTDFLPEGRPARDPREVLAETVRLLVAERWLIAKIVIGSALLAVIVSLLLPPRYESTTRLLPAPASTAPADMTRMLRPEASALAGLTGLATPSGEERFMALLQSRVIADRVIDRFDLMKVYGVKRRSGARKILSLRTNVQEERRTGVITVTVTDRDPKRAADMAAAYVEELEKFNAEMNTTGAHMERLFLEKRVQEIGNELNDAANRLSQFSAKHSLLDGQEQAKSTVNAALQLSAQLIAARAELRGLEQVYAPSSLKVRMAQAKVGELEKELTSIEGVGQPDAGSDDGSLPSIHQLPDLAVSYAELYRRTKLLEAVQMLLTQQLEAAKTEEVKQLPAFRVMEPAEVPELRVFPKRTLIVLTVTGASLLLAIAFVIGRARWQRISPDDPLKILLADATLKLDSLRLPGRVRHIEQPFAGKDRE